MKQEVTIKVIERLQLQVKNENVLYVELKEASNELLRIRSHAQQR